MKRDERTSRISYLSPYAEIRDVDVLYKRTREREIFSRLLLQQKSDLTCEFNKQNATNVFVFIGIRSRSPNGVQNFRSSSLL